RMVASVGRPIMVGRVRKTEQGLWLRNMAKLIRFAVLGDGAWGTCVALLLARNPEHQVTLWSAREENAQILRERRENLRLLPGVAIPATVELTTDAAHAVADAELCITAIPTLHLRPTLQRIRQAIRPQQPVVSLTKGLEIETFLRPTEIVQETLGT